MQRYSQSPDERLQVPAIVLDVVRSPGQPLDGDTQVFMESRFGHDFSRVRVHADARAAESARAINALAYTVGRDVVFGSGQYEPATEAGRLLLAHELTHVVQQSANGVAGKELELGDSDSAHEREAESVSARAGDNAAVHSAAHPAQRPADTRLGVVQRIGPAGAAAAGAAAGVIIGVVSFEAALSYGKSLATRFPGWLSLLPDCPCSEADVLADPATWGRDANPILSYFHPGASSSYRSNATFSSVPGTAHGQQCTYDSSGNLITEGPGAGSPDAWSPNANAGYHFTNDVLTWQVLGWRIYNRYWQPNNGNGCAANRGENTLGRRISEFLP